MTLAVGTVVAAAWALHVCFARSMADWTAQRLGSKLLAMGRGRITDPAQFVYDRAFDLVWLVSVVAVLIAVGAVAYALLERRITKAWLWLPVSLFVFAEVNVFVALASETGLYWMALHAGHQNLKQTGFHAERILMRDSPATAKAVVIGSSQGMSEIHTGELIRDFYPQVHVAQMSYAGARAFDFLLIRDHYRESSPETVICYLSEQVLYTPVSAARYLPLLRVAGLRNVAELEAWRFSDAKHLIHGGLAMAMPVFRVRRAIKISLFGEDFTVRGRRDPKPSDEKPSGNPDDVVRRKAAEYRVGPGSDFQKRALERFLVKSRSDGTKVVLIAGQVNPHLAEMFAPQVREDFPKYLHDLSRRFPEVIVLFDELPHHVVEDYDDSMHIKPEERLRYTDCLARVLQQKLGWQRRRDSATTTAPDADTTPASESSSGSGQGPRRLATSVP